jgi:phage gpG-like protein
MQIEGDFSALEKLIKELKSSHYVDVGVLGEASYENGVTVAAIGAVHEFGSLSGNIPERSFIRMPLEKKQGEIAESITKSNKWQALAEKQDIKGLFKIIGIACEGAIQEAFDTGGFGTWQALEQSTIDAKGSESILIDEGTLRKSITSEAGKGK